MEDLNLDSLEINGKFRGRAKTVRSQSISGRYVKAAPVRETERSYDLAADATIRSALLRQAGNGGAAEGISISSADLHKKIYQRQVRSLIIFVVDASESMGEDGAEARIRAAKGTILGILTKAYQKRFRVGLVSFADESAEIVLQPTSSLPLAQKCLRSLPVGGGNAVRSRAAEGLADDQDRAAQRPGYPATDGGPLGRGGKCCLRRWCGPDQRCR